MFYFARDMKTSKIDATSDRTIKAHDGSLMASEMRFAPGGVGAMHQHPHEQIVYVLTGEADFTLGAETQRIGVGDTVYVPPNLVHGLVAVTEFRALDVFTPQREDFL